MENIHETFSGSTVELPLVKNTDPTWPEIKAMLKTQ